MVKKVFPDTRKRNETFKEKSDSEESDCIMKLVSTDDEDSTDDWDCVYCGEAYKHDKRGEHWIRFTRCHRWAHELYADNETGVTFANENNLNVFMSVHFSDLSTFVIFKFY